MAGNVVFRRHYRRGGEDITVSSDEKLTSDGWDKMVKERHGEGWVQIAPHLVLKPFERASRRGMLL